MAKNFGKTDWPDTKYRQFGKRKSPAFPQSGEKKSTTPTFTTSTKKGGKKTRTSDES